MASIIRSFLNGTCFNAYEYFGAHATVRRGQQGTVFRVYAPHAQRVELVSNFNGWMPVPMSKVHSCGVYEVFLTDAQPGHLYKYRIYNENSVSPVRDRCDPFARASEVRPANSSIVPAAGRFTFRDSRWRKEQAGSYDKPIHIYELHVGSWKRHSDGSFYGYRELAKALIPYCREHYFTHVEFLPLAEHPVDGSWGYQCTGYFSVTSRYGAPEDFLYLVDRLHRAGIGVIMDLVAAHFALDEHALAHFDGASVYEYDDASGLRTSEWGSCNFDYGKSVTRSFMQSAADFWINYCHCDGIRFDAVCNLLYVQGDAGRGENTEGMAFLRQCNRGIRQRYPYALLIAEDSTPYDKTTAPVESGGLGFDYKWDLGWTYDTLKFFALSPKKRKNAEEYEKLLFSMHYFYQNRYLLPFSHDEAARGRKTILDKMWGEYEQKFAQCRALFTYFYLHPGKKLTFMGNEFGHFREWQEYREMDWMLLDFPMHKGFYRYVKALSRLYTDSPSLYRNETDPEAFRWVVADDPEHSVLAFERRDGEEALVCVLNLSDRPLPDYALPFAEPVMLREVINSDTMQYGGTGMTNDWAIYSREESQRHVAHISLAAFGACVFRIVG